MREIELHTNKPEWKGLTAKVDDRDYARLTGDDDNGRLIRWNIWKKSSDDTLYAHAPNAIIEGHRAPKMHRMILGILGESTKYADHKDHDGLNNQRCNIRCCTQSQNMMNMRPRKDGTSIYVNVDWYKPNRKWRARIPVNGKQRHLGYFTNEIDAALAHDMAAKKDLDFEFRVLNFPTLRHLMGAIFKAALIVGAA